MRAIDGFARILEEELEAGDPAQAPAHLARIRKATARMAELIDALINLAMLTRQPLQKETFDLSLIASQIADELHAVRASAPAAIATQTRRFTGTSKN